MKDYEFILNDRIAKIQAINEQYDLLNNSYIAFSGGKDSTILHYLIDIALPGNKIPRVYANTGLEYKYIRKFVEELQQHDDRIIIINQTQNIKQTLQKYGYPFKSKDHSQRVDEFNKGICPNTTYGYVNGGLTKNGRPKKTCPKKLLYQFEEHGKYNISQQCCYKLKKNLMEQFSVSSGRNIIITGMRKGEGGSRLNINCISMKNGKLHKFHPLLIVDKKFEDEFIKNKKIKLCELFYEPYNFDRTGCVGCPYNKDLKKDLELLKKYLPNEYKKACLIWQPVYDEYKRINYRLKGGKNETDKQTLL